MEVLDTGNHLKDAENQASAGNYTCRLPKDLTIGSSTVARNRGEVDVRLLLACKTQLSTEVVRLKTDSLRLQKERDAARIRMKELDQILMKFSERTRELENRLHASEEENKRLRARMVGLSNVSALQKLSVSLDKFHSYPWLDAQSNPLATPNSCSNTLETKKNNPPPQEDWREVSQKLLEQMKQEMKEIKEMSNNFSLQESNPDSANEVKQESCEDKACDETLEESLSNLMSETKSLKHSLLKQRKTLKSLMYDIKLGHIQLKVAETPKDESKSFKSNDSNEDKSVLSVKPKSSQYSRHSDDSFHAFFTKQLDSGCQNIDKMNRAMQLFMQSSPSSEGSKTSQVTSPKTVKSPISTGKQNHDKKITEEERVCPICQLSFDVSIAQEDFEGHVLDHLEAESASLLDQYVVL